MRLTKILGTVAVSTDTNLPLPGTVNMRLYDGYRLETAIQSYAWINLDNVKLTKLDEASRASLRKQGKELEILLESGGIFFNVSKPLEEDESLSIRTSAMAVGIRGTSGWVRVIDGKTSMLSVLEGVVEVTVRDPVTGQTKTESVYAGETVIGVIYEPTVPGDKCDIIRDKYTKADIPGFVLVELAQDAALMETIYQASGADLRDMTPQDAQTRLQKDEAETAQRLAQADDPQKKQPNDTSAPFGENQKPAPDMTPAPGAGSNPNGVPGKTTVPAAGATPNPGTNPGTGANPNSGTNPGTDANTDPDVGSDSGSGPASPGTNPDPGTNPGSDTSTVLNYDPSAFPRQLSDSLEAYDEVVIERPASITGPVTLNESLVIPEGRKVIMNAPFAVVSSLSLDIYGTMIINGDLTNDGAITVHSANTLEVTGTLATTEPGSLTITATGKVRTANLTGPVNLNPGGQVLFKTQEISNLPNGSAAPAWGLLGMTGDNAYSSLWIYDADTHILFLSGEGAMPDYNRNTAKPTPWESHKPNIREVVIHPGMTYIGQEAFRQCSGLTNATIPDSVTRIGFQAFFQCGSLTNAAIPDSVTRIDKQAFYQCSLLTGDFAMLDNVTYIGVAAFTGCISLTGKLTVPDDAQAIQWNAFTSCTGLTDVTITAIETGGIDSYTFSYCSSLANVTLGNKISKIWNGAFRDCTSLTSITLPDNLKMIGEEAFYNCTSLTSVNIPYSVTSLYNGAFANCTALKTVYYGGTQADWIELLRKKNATPGSYVIFQGIPEPYPTMVYAAGAGKTGSLWWSFRQDNGTLTIGGSGTMPDYHDASAPWESHRPDIRKVVINPGVTGIGINAFSQCAGLTGIYIPRSVTAIGDSAFADCSNLGAVNYEGTEEEWNAVVKGSDLFSGITTAPRINCNAKRPAP